MATSTDASAPSIEATSDSLDLLFHGAGYSLALTVARAGGGAGSEPCLAIDLEELSTGAAWHAEFSASYVEMVTSKTGSSKRFDVFVKMLRGALFRQSDTVFLDLLTYADLVRRRPLPWPPPPPPPPLLPAAVGAGGWVLTRARPPSLLQHAHPAGAAARAEGRLPARARAAGLSQAVPLSHLRHTSKARSG